MKKAYLAELVGTFFLVFCGCGSAVAFFSLIGNGPTAIGIVSVSLSFGFILTGIIYAIGHVSGAHVNPAVTVAAFLDKRIKGMDAAMYVLFQLAGACLAVIALMLVAGRGFGLGQTTVAKGFKLYQGFLLEVFLTMIFVTVILTATKKEETSKFAGLAIGMVLTVVHLIGFAITGPSVNPARSIAPALFMLAKDATAMKQIWVYIFGPLVGAGLGYLLYALITPGVLLFAFLKPDAAPAVKKTVPARKKTAAKKKTVKKKS